MAVTPIRVLVWDDNPTLAPELVYPTSIRGALAAGITELIGEEHEILARSIEDADQGLDADTLEKTDVLVWWGHQRHEDVSDERVALIKERVHKKGMGFIALHSAHYSKPFKAILGCEGFLRGGWRESNEPEHIRVCAPDHPIAAGIIDFNLAQEEAYGAPFDVPPPAVVVLQSYFPAVGDYFPSGLAWTVGTGIDPNFRRGVGGKGQGQGIARVFYLRPGHETLPTYLNTEVLRLIANAVRWCAWRT